ncbi:MAG: DUF115 domain-containing protein [Desulfobulbaceae bacterium]|nr:DUF115 domain-containing protein [Desulfobulbaceae bacterium]
MGEPDQDFFKINLGLLKKHHPDLWRRLQDNPPRPTGEIVFSPQGRPNLQVQNIHGEAVTFHRESDPKAEISQFFTLVPPDATGFVVFLGMGMGYAPLAFLEERTSLNRIVIIELDDGVFWQALQAMDLAPLLKNPRVTLLVGANPDIAERLGVFIAALATESIYILEHFGAFAFDRDSYVRLKDDFYLFANAMNISGSTMKAYGKTFVANRFRQLTGIGHDYFLDSLRGAFAGTPAILVAGGPSLNKNIHLLEQAKNKAVIIAVDAAAPPLLARGVKPDFVGSIDMQPLTYEKYGDHASDLAGVSLVCAPWVTPKVPKFLNVERVLWLFSHNDMERWLNSLLGGKLTFPGAGTVAQLNFYTAILLGCSPIIFVGQDFAFSEDQSHADNIVLSSTKEVQKQLNENNELHHVPGTLGGTVITNRAYLGMKHTFEETIRTNPNTYINATEGGAHIEGTRVMPLHHVLAEFCQDGSTTVATRITDKLEQATPPNIPLLNKEFRATLKAGQLLSKQIGQSDKIGRRILGELGKLDRRSAQYSCFAHLPQGIQKQLAQNDMLHGQIDQSPTWHLLQDMTAEGLRDTERMKVAIEQLADDPRKYLQWIRKSMDRLLAVNKVRRQVLADFLARISQTIKNFEIEQELLRPEKATLEDRLALARQYLFTGDIRLARSLLEKLLPDNVESAEIHFLLGKIAALQGDFTAADDYFSQTRFLSPSLGTEIDVFRHECAEEYLTLSRQIRAEGSHAISNMLLLKGARYDCSHVSLRQEISAALAQDLAEVAAGTLDADVVRFWYENLILDPRLAKVLSLGQLAALRFAQGQLWFDEQKFLDALAEFEHAAAVAPNEPRFQIAIFEAAFNCLDFDRAIAALGLAVTLDRSLAGHWEELGDLLLSVPRPSDALAAYEQCFAVQPEQVRLLKKIGDCYLAMNQLEAAREAYLFYQQKTIGAAASLSS